MVAGHSGAYAAFMQRSIRPETTDRHGSIARRTARALAGTLAAGLITGLMAGPALGANSVHQSVEPGTRSVVSDLSLDSVASAGADRIISGTLTVTVDDGTGTGAGWDVTIRASALVNTSSPAAPEIPASSLALGEPETPVALAGQSVDAAHGPIAGTGGSLDAARTVVSAGRDHGMGTYTQSVPMTLQVPAGAASGTYTGTIVVSFGSGPEQHETIEFTIGSASAETSPGIADMVVEAGQHAAHLVASTLSSLWQVLWTA